ncbi:MAG: hypothetical protein ACM3QS_18260 [Bacteroidota bacterium]
MRRIDARIVLGLMLLLGGGLLLLQAMGYLTAGTHIFWGLVFLVGGLAFLSLPFSGNWWGVFPGMTLLGLAVLILFEDRLGIFGGLVFLGALALAFWLVYILDRQRWWALIPAGVLSTLAIVTVVPDYGGGVATGAVFFLGLALTFLLVALAAGLRWAYYPAAALGVIGVLAAASLMDLANYIWALALIAAGGFLVLRFFRNR